MFFKFVVVYKVLLLDLICFSEIVKINFIYLKDIFVIPYTKLKSFKFILKFYRYKYSEFIYIYTFFYKFGIKKVLFYGITEERLSLNRLKWVQEQAG